MVVVGPGVEKAYGLWGGQPCLENRKANGAEGRTCRRKVEVGGLDLDGTLGTKRADVLLLTLHCMSSVSFNHPHLSSELA